MIARYALVIPATEGVQIFFVQRANYFGHILPSIVQGARDRIGNAGGVDLQIRRRDGEPLIGIDLGVCRMIDNYERVMIDVISFAQLGSDAQILISIAGRKLVSADLHPLLGLLNPGGNLRIDVQAERGAPRRAVFDELDRLAVPGEERWAGALQPL